MPIELYRIDDRLVHGQVVVGWGQPLNVNFVVLVDDAIASSDWEQELYRMGAPPEMSVTFESLDSALAHLAEYQSRPGHGILLAGDVEHRQARLFDDLVGFSGRPLLQGHLAAGGRVRCRPCSPAQPNAVKTFPRGSAA